MIPSQLLVRKRHTRVIEVAADSANSGPVTLTYRQDPATLFDYFPPAPVTLRPNAPPEVFVLKRNLGIEERGTFINTDPRYARVFSINPTPQADCSDGGGDRWVVEC